MCDIFSCLIGRRNNRLRVFRHPDPDVHSHRAMFDHLGVKPRGESQYVEAEVDPDSKVIELRTEATVWWSGEDRFEALELVMAAYRKWEKDRTVLIDGVRYALNVEHVDDGYVAVLQNMAPGDLVVTVTVYDSGDWQWMFYHGTIYPSRNTKYDSVASVERDLYAIMREHGYAKAIPLIKALP